MTGLAGVLLAAGSSSRLGDRSKQMLDIDGEPLVRRQAALLTQCCESGPGR
jgi:CTP:molybdopterin cytidylyltransferase MocA